jgi:hypothetical protein
LSAPVTPELCNRSFTTSSDSRAGTSLHHVASLAPSKSVVGLSDRDREGASSPMMRIRSKVTTISKSQSVSITGTISPPLQPSTCPASSHMRSPLVTSLPTSPPLIQHQIYPITTAVPAANPHRFIQSRPPSIRNPAIPFQNNNTFQLLNPSSSDDRPPPLIAKVDPAFIPLPPHSPPTSALSFSSRSSASQSSASHTAGSTDSQLSPVVSGFSRHTAGCSPADYDPSTDTSSSSGGR